MEPTPPPPGKMKRWIGSAGLIAGATFLLGRLAVEPARTLPQFDERGMDTVAAVETYRLRENPHDMEIAVLGSSVAIWGIVPELLARHLNRKPEVVRKLATVGGTPFDYWILLRRNPEEFKHLKLVLIEISPRMMNPNQEFDGRHRYTVSQHASIAERMKLKRYGERTRQMADYVLPFQSVRRSLNSAFLNIVQPPPGSPIYPRMDARLYPFSDWHVTDKPYFRDTVTPPAAAARLSSNWRFSKMYDQSLRKVLAWFQKEGVPVIFFQMPVHPEVMKEIHLSGKCETGYQRYQEYLTSLGAGPRNMVQSHTTDECGIGLDGLRDYTHLNERGAKIYSAYLAARVLELGGLPE